MNYRETLVRREPDGFVVRNEDLAPLINSLGAHTVSNKQAAACTRSCCWFCGDAMAACICLSWKKANGCVTYSAFWYVAWREPCDCVKKAMCIGYVIQTF